MEIYAIRDFQICTLFFVVFTTLTELDRSFYMYVYLCLLRASRILIMHNEILKALKCYGISISVFHEGNLIDNYFILERI